MPVVTIDVGCGPEKHPDAVYGVDCLPLPGVDFVVDLEKDRLPFDDNSVDGIYTRHTLEHIGNLDGLLREMVRVAKPDARLQVIVPHFSNTLGYSDYTHRRFFGYYTFDYFSQAKDRRWKVPNYTSDIRFRINRKQLCFQNLSILRPVAEWLFNSGTLMPYIYESKLAWLVPCFEIKFDLQVIKS
jgi:SAM-dependent methyltransferase